MKKKLFILICLVAMTVTGVFSSKHQFNESKMFDDNCEALTACDITVSYVNRKTKEAVIVLQYSCPEEGECHQSYEVPKELSLITSIPEGTIMTVSCDGKAVSEQ